MIELAHDSDDGFFRSHARVFRIPWSLGNFKISLYIETSTGFITKS